MDKPKILLIDIETAPNLCSTWGLFKQNISIGQIMRAGYTLCFAAKWLGKKKVHFHRVEDVHGTPKFDKTMKEMAGAAHALVDEADAIIHYNGTNFDLPTLNREFISAGLTPPSPQTQVDLLRVVRKQFRFTSNKLDYVAQALGLAGKVQHKGMELWNGCMEDDPASWRIMRKYNIQDVVMMEPLYEKLLPWIQPHPNLAIYGERSDEGLPVCVNCGSSELVARGFAYTTTQRYRRYRCKSCGKWNRDRKNCTPNKKSVLSGVSG